MPPDVRDIGLPGELVGAQVGEQDGVALLHPVLHVLHPGQTRPRLQAHGPPKLCDHLVLATEQLWDLIFKDVQMSGFPLFILPLC